MRAHLGLVVFVVLMAAGVALEIVGQNLLCTALIIVTLSGQSGRRAAARAAACTRLTSIPASSIHHPT